MSTVVLTMNEKDTLPGNVARADLERVIDETNPDFGGLQEWGMVRDGLAADVLNARGYNYARATKGGGPVFYRARDYSQCTTRAIRLSRGEFVGHLIGRRSKLGPSWATEVVLSDVVSGLSDGLSDVRQTVVLNYHLTAEVQFRSGYRTDLKHRLRVMRHKREKRRLGKRARWHLRRGRRIFALGDSNYDGMHLGGFVSCWEGHYGNTLGGRAVDIIFAQAAPTHVRTFDTHSDHKAVAATYKE